MLKRIYKTYGEYAGKWAERQRSGQNVSHEYLEKPAMMAALPDVKVKSVLCLGCGTGEECRMLKDLGAARVVGVEKESEMIKLAKEAYPDIEFAVMPIEKLDFPAATFDVVYSSLVMHYAKDWTVPLAQVHNVLKPGGIFLFSAHHPIWHGAEKVRDEEKFITRMGAAKVGKDGHEIHGDYLNTRQIKDTLFNELEIEYYHKPLSEVVNDIIASGFIIKKFLEPKATEEAKVKKHNFWAVHQKIPLVMIFELQK